MSKREEFMDALRHYLSDFGNDEREEILYDYEEHFRIGMESGKTEDELIKELGSPRDIAAQYRNTDDNSKVNSNQSVGGSIGIFIALVFFNLVFILGPYLGILGALIGMCCGAIGVLVAGVVTTICTILRPIFPGLVSTPNGIPDISIFFVGIGTTALGILFCIGMFYLVKFFMGITVKYVKWNIKTIKGE
ncbi:MULTISPECIES: HAAS signaling domain-containing protein [Clostridium]|uniref:HAAS signaling domain-containing protein n=1 Tax=Clostridium TaxID=1485 RepID=UPI00069F6C89|nr:MULTISPECIES: DUF1700 domain-containing protein [Clostridium]KOF57098.1 membrane protein [Clostridium sp. DMHC 10]MCD2348676.1 DUF1700 domain-containing protein [Clostridium guangxiense]